MNFCRACGKTVHETAANCPHCGAVQQAVKLTAMNPHEPAPIWTSITGLVLGIMAVLSALQFENWNKSQVLGVAVFAIAALVLGCVSLTKHHRGKGMAIAAVMLGGISLLAALGS